GEPPSPVQHYWSLAVEEQFYIVIPVLLLLVAVVVRRRSPDLSVEARRRALRRAVVVVLGVVTLASLAWSVHVTAVSPTGAYFSTAARAWELGIGGLAAAALWGSTPRLGRWATEAVLAAGLAMIAWATLVFDARTAVPGSIVLVPVLGAALMLVAGGTTAAPSTFLFRLFSLGPARVIGDWSYSLYLWHFPVLRLCEEYWGEPRLSRPHLAVALVAILALSAASYHFIEQPFRKGVRWRPRLRAIALYPASLAMVVLTAFGANAWVDGQLAAIEDNPRIDVSDYARDGLSKDPAVALVEASVLAAEDGRPVPGGLRPALGTVRDSVAPLGDCDYRTGTRELCPFGDPDADRVIVVTGDSHARHWGPALDEIGAKHGYRVYHFVYSGCPATTVTRPGEGGGEWTECAEFKAWALDQIRELHPALVVVANNAYKSAFMARRQVAGLRSQLELLTPLADRVALVGNTPVLPRAAGTCVSQRDVDLSDCLQRGEAGTARVQGQFGAAAESLGLTFVDAHRWFCWEGRCPSVIGDVIPFRDREHVTVEYATQLAGPLATALRITR
ncbi:MAG TPA: acyltransferase family protein, partial [Nocardioides sp.]|nr:acyltransferase family protein [Nocardioides sp.]